MTPYTDGHCHQAITSSLKSQIQTNHALLRQYCPREWQSRRSCVLQRGAGKLSPASTCEAPASAFDLQRERRPSAELVDPRTRRQYHDIKVDTPRYSSTLPDTNELVLNAEVRKMKLNNTSAEEESSDQMFVKDTDV